MKISFKEVLLVPALALGATVGFGQTADLTVASFDGSDYGAWRVAGTAFGPGPAQGTLPGQMTVDGFQGIGLVNSFNGGDAATGRLTSPAFIIERRYLQFLVGGGGWAGKTCINLLRNGDVVRTASGPNTEPGGSERLQPAQWDVAELLGQTVTLEIVDEATGTWGHINVDQIVQSDRRSAAPIQRHHVTRDIVLEQPFLNFPVKNGASKKRVTLSVAGTELHGFDIELADAEPDWWAFLDAAPWRGKTVTVTVDQLADTSRGLSAIDQTAAIKEAPDLYREAQRPQFHFTSRRGWLNDPNGLVYYAGEYHLFYQHNPYGWNWGNMHWGHAVSQDLVHWQELPVALYPDRHGTMYSGSAVVDWNNTAGFQTGKEPALVAMFTAAGRPFTQGLAYSNDRGRTWTKYAHNPVLGHIVHENRDPKVIWYAPEQKWVMALYLDHNDFALFASRDLKRWDKLCDVKLPGDAECPEFFELPVDGNPQNTRWIFYGANGRYLVGNFNGQQFTPESGPHPLQHGNCWYASQTYNDIPAQDGRRILVPWGRLPDGEIFRGMKFNQMMGLPVELTLRTWGSGAPRLAVTPVRELTALRHRTHTINAQPLTAGANPLAGITGDALEIEAVFKVGGDGAITFDLLGLPLSYDLRNQTLSGLKQQATVPPQDGKLSLRIFVDRGAVDIFGADGRLYMPLAMRFSPGKQALRLSASGGTVAVESLKVHELKSAW